MRTKTDQITVASRTITVNIKTLNVGGSVTVTYGAGGDKEKAVLNAKKATIGINGNYRTSSGTHSAGKAEVKIDNVKDGAAEEVTITPKQVEAGSSHSALYIKFTALGTMGDAGQVSVDLPSGWGPAQRDPAEHNYIRITGTSNVSIDSPAVGESSSKIIAKIKKLEADQSFTFEYGGGSSSSNNGAEIQDNIDIATFTVESDGDGDGVFDAVTSEKKFEGTEKATNPDQLGTIFAKIGRLSGDGQLRVQVQAQADGTGTVEVAPKTVRAAADNVELKFTYTATQTIRDGELRFTRSLWVE